jgi:hypothetical protein
MCLEIAEVVCCQEQADEGDAVRVIFQAEPAMGLEQLVSDNPVRHWRTK